MKAIALHKNQKGFTLVEIIVVLVILAILAAIAIPSMTGFIDDARKKALVADTRAGYVAAQAIASEQYARGKDADYTVTRDSPLSNTNIKKLIGDPNLPGNYMPAVKDGKVISITYAIVGGHKCQIRSNGDVNFDRDMVIE